jgi:2-amino-4-hydroxy-6-hydroxymethyldihydropteridine diphosphokinase
MEKIYISLGSNLGDRQNNLLEACKLIEKQLGEIKHKSKIYETEPWGFESSNQFLNQVIYLSSNKPAQNIMEIALSIENEMGRVRNQERYSSRVIDIDVLFVGAQILKNDVIEVPHPRLHKRNFVLTPLKEIAPEFIHPVFEKPVRDLLNECEDKLEVKVCAGQNSI